MQANAPLPTSGVTMNTSSHNYESDPGVTWDVSLSYVFLSFRFILRDYSKYDVYPLGSIEFFDEY